MTRVLITGAGGFVGSHMLHAVLRDTDWDVVTVGSFRHNGAYDRLTWAAREGSGWQRMTNITHDLAAPMSPMQRRRLGQVDYVLDIASRCSVPDSIREPGDFIINNVSATVQLLETLRAMDRLPRRIIHMSTDEVYGPMQAGSVTDHKPSSPYAASKAAQEDICHAYARTFHMPITVLNSANMIGEGQSMLAYVPRLVKTISEGGTVMVHAVDGIPGERCYSYAGNVASLAVSLLIKQNDPMRTFTPAARFLQPGQAKLDNLAMASKVAALLDKPLVHRLVESDVIRPGYDPQYMGLPYQGDWGRPTFDEALRRTVEWFVEHPEWLT